MKENAVLKINKLGKISGIITLVAKILVAVGIGICLLGTIIFAVIPKEFMTVNMSGNAIIDINLAALGIPEDDLNMEEEVLSREEIEASGSFEMYNANYYIQSMTTTGSSIQVDAVADDMTLNMHGFSIVMFICVLYLTMTMVTLFFIGALCKSFRYCTSPFEDNVIKKMQQFAISLIPWAFMSSIADMAVQGYFTGRVQIGVGVDLGIVVTILLILVLVYIFKYGAVLQQESDETL